MLELIVGCTPLVVGLHPCSLCEVLSWYAKHPRHTSGGSGGGSPQPQPSPNQCHASHLRRATNSVQPTIPTSALALLTTCCCFHIVLHFLLLLLYIRCNLHCTYPNLVLYIVCLLVVTHHLSGGITIIPASSSPFPASCTYKVTLQCTVDHNSLKRALDWAETSEFYTWHWCIWFLASVVTRIIYHDRT